MSVYKALMKIATTPVKAAYGTGKGAMEIGTTLTHDAIKGVSSLIGSSFKMRKGTYKENLLRGNIIPMKLKAPASIALGGGIVAYGTGKGALEYNEERYEKNATIDHMEATGDIVLSNWNNR